MKKSILVGAIFLASSSFAKLTVCTPVFKNSESNFTIEKMKTINGIDHIKVRLDAFSANLTWRTFETDDKNSKLTRNIYSNFERRTTNDTKNPLWEIRMLDYKNAAGDKILKSVATLTIATTSEVMIDDDTKPTRVVSTYTGLFNCKADQE